MRHDAPVLVTGAPGNVGTPVVDELIGLGASIRVAAWDVDAARAAFGDRVEVVQFNFSTFATDHRDAWVPAAQGQS